MRSQGHNVLQTVTIAVKLLALSAVVGARRHDRLACGLVARPIARKRQANNYWDHRHRTWHIWRKGQPRRHPRRRRQDGKRGTQASDASGSWDI